jgi:hypothetical protein
MVRPYRREDLAAVRTLLGDERALALPGARAHVAAADPRAGVAVWLEPAGDEGLLAFVATDVRFVSPNNGRRLLYELARVCAREALARGVRGGRFVLRDARLRATIARDFAVETEARAIDPRTGEAVEWEVRVDVAEAARSLDRWLNEHA